MLLAIIRLGDADGPATEVLVEASVRELVIGEPPVLEAGADAAH